MRSTSRITAILVAVLWADLVLAAPRASAAEITAGDWTIVLSGFVSGYFQMGMCDHSADVVAGGASCNTGPGGENRAAVSNGLGVGHFGVSASTKKDGWVLGGAAEIWSGLNSLPDKVGFGETGPSIRQSYAFFGRDSIGMFKVGRIFGVFGSDAIANDMTLSGVGSGGAGVSGAVGNSTLGRMGVGYIYADFMPQLQYATPTFFGFQVVAALTQAWDASPIAAMNSVSLIEHSLPGFQAKATYDWGGPVAGRAWVSGWAQQSSSSNGQFTAIEKITSAAVDLGARLELSGFQLVGYFFLGDGVGIMAPMRDGVALVGGKPVKRSSNGYYGQLTYKIGDLKLGASYGACNLDVAQMEVGAEQLVAANSSIIGGAYYTLGGVVTLVAEWTHTIAENQAGAQLSDNSFALGASAGF